MQKPSGDAASRRPSSGPNCTDPLFARFDVRSTAMSGWVHDLRSLDAGGRVALPELAQLVEGDPQCCGIEATLRTGCWILRPSRRVAAPVGLSLGGRSRLAVPLGVRHQLGVQGTTGVSVSTESRAVLLWAPAWLDRLAEGALR